METGTTPDGINNPPTRGGAASAGPTQAKGGLLSGPIGVLLSIGLLGVAGYLGYRTYDMSTGNAPQEAPDATAVMYICSESKKPFEHVPKLGERTPVFSPHSNKNTGYRAEKCYWTRDGKVKDTPTYVLLNEFAGIPGPTKCPDCGRLVEPHNKRPPANATGDIQVPAVDTGGSKAPTLAPTTQPAG